MVEGVNLSMIYLIYCKNFCKCHNVLPSSQTIQKFFKNWEWLNKPGIYYCLRSYCTIQAGFIAIIHVKVLYQLPESSETEKTLTQVNQRSFIAHE
jgi:hypothetical protein